MKIKFIEVGATIESTPGVEETIRMGADEKVVRFASSHGQEVKIPRDIYALFTAVETKGGLIV